MAVNATVTFFAQHADISLKNAGGSTAYVTEAAITGTKLIEQEQFVKGKSTPSAQNLTSQSNYGKKEYALDNKFIFSSDAAQKRAKFVVDANHNPNPLLDNVEVPGMPQLQVGDRVRVREINSGIDSDYAIIRVNHDLSKDSFVTSLTLRKAGNEEPAWTGVNNNVGNTVQILY